MELNEKFLKIQNVKGSIKNFVTNKYVLGSAIIGSVAEGRHLIKSINIHGGLFSPITDVIKNFDFMGMPIGEPISKLVGFSLGGLLVAEGCKVYFECREHPERTFAIIIREGVLFIIMIVGLHFIGTSAIEIFKSINGFEFKL